IGGGDLLGDVTGLAEGAGGARGLRGLGSVLGLERSPRALQGLLAVEEVRALGPEASEVAELGDVLARNEEPREATPDLGDSTGGLVFGLQALPHLARRV